MSINVDTTKSNETLLKLTEAIQYLAIAIECSNKLHLDNKILNLSFFSKKHQINIIRNNIIKLRTKIHGILDEFERIEHLNNLKLDELYIYYNAYKYQVEQKIKNQKYYTYNNLMEELSKLTSDSEKQKLLKRIKNALLNDPSKLEIFSKSIGISKEQLEQDLKNVDDYITFKILLPENCTFDYIYDYFMKDDDVGYSFEGWPVEIFGKYKRPQKYYDMKKIMSVIFNDNLRLEVFAESISLHSETVKFLYEETINQKNNTILKFEENNFTLDDFVDLGNFYYQTKINYNNIYVNDYTPQGITKLDNMYLISAYSDYQNSRVYLYDETGKFGSFISLPNDSHVGGITYDKKNKMILIAADGGEMMAVPYKFFKDNKDQFFGFQASDSMTLNSSEIFNEHMQNTEIKKTSTLYFDGEYLYVATFNPLDKGEMLRFKIKDYDQENNIINFEEEVVKYEIPRQVQGIAVTEYKGKKYLIVSQSIGKDVDSNVLLYEMTADGGKKYLGKYYEKSGLEGITVNENGTVTFVTEWASDGIKTTMDEILKKVDVDCNTSKKEQAANLKAINYVLNNEHYIEKIAKANGLNEDDLRQELENISDNDGKGANEFVDRLENIKRK